VILRRALPVASVSLSLLMVTVVTLRASADVCVQGSADLTGCRLDLVNGPVLAGSRVTALSGAYQGLAQGLEGFAANAAAPAVRQPWSTNWFEYDLDASISFPTLFRNVDFENRGSLPSLDFHYRDFVVYTVGANVQFGAWGVGATLSRQTFNVTPEGPLASGFTYTASVTKAHLLVAHQFFDPDLVVGTGLRLVGFGIGRSGGGSPDESLVSVFGVAPELGALVQPELFPFRIGATFRFPVESQTRLKDATRPPLALPSGAKLPWEVDVGFAVQAGPRPLNIRWLDPRIDRAPLESDIARARERRAKERVAILAVTLAKDRAAREKQLEEEDEKERKEEEIELAEFNRDLDRVRKARYRQLPRDYLLLTLGLLVTGTTDEGISLESYLQDSARRSGRFVTYSPRAGLEMEPLPNRLTARLGTYVEPSRFTDRPDAFDFRQHLTAGLEVALFRFSVFGLVDDQTTWRIAMMVDYAARYSNYGLSIGIWH
jgi:hypothetical protein